MLFSIFDLFSQPFSFNTGNYQLKRGTCVGTIISFAVFFVTISYFIYILQQYAQNQIDPIFRSQSFISQDQIETPLKSELVGFRFESDNSINLSVNRTYLVYLAFLQYNSANLSQFIPINIVDCTNPNLQGFKCLDFTSVQNYTLFLNTNQNSKSTVQIMTYGCRDQDKLKTFIPENCAEQVEIDKLINGINSLLRLKLYTSQYNTASQRIEVNYRNAYVYTVANQQILTQLKIQNQHTSVQQGLIVQKEQKFSSPIEYNQQDQGLDKEYAIQNVGAGSYSIVILMMDEIIQEIYIQYPTLPQILAMVSGVFTILMFLGIFGKKVSQNSIQKDFFLLFLKNVFQENYLQILKKNNYYHIKEGEQEVEVNHDQILFSKALDSDNQQIKNIKQKKTIQPISVPVFSSKRKISIEKVENTNINQSQNTDNFYFSSKNIQLINNFQSSQCTNQQNNDNLSENLSLKKYITENAEEITQVSQNKNENYQQEQQILYGDITNYSPQDNVLKKSIFSKMNDTDNFQFSQKNIQLINNLQQAQSINLQNNQIVYENVSQKNNITADTQETTQVSKNNQQQQQKSNFNKNNQQFCINNQDQTIFEREKKFTNIINNYRAIQDVDSTQKIIQDIRKINNNDAIDKRLVSSSSPNRLLIKFLRVESK
ncbi:transmembrane protein, putative (macronuclear) [Tetrahymena thermophila SB210]|uniref:Transmembrane protein, putative n=1 Tax=Tetrahymena thermophila (strain SB210) TaxID=312017 RepID=Q241X0_TETTS|nr:transmembrane protein, putative [Tetrahymena thermophila SB210]EAS02581.2 transmembrane protein, putative [Tetrahymena thermophila SB210]|eukprot:XP_001022826.2 transmembrane protein, putative [Tetrahymena thermophila SB210]